MRGFVDVGVAVVVAGRGDAPVAPEEWSRLEAIVAKGYGSPVVGGRPVATRTQGGLGGRESAAKVLAASRLVTNAADCPSPQLVRPRT